MTPEPVNTAGVIVGMVSAITLALLGVDYYSILWAYVGALFAVWFRPASGRDEESQKAPPPQATGLRQNWKRKLSNLAYVVLSTLIGAACGTAVVEFAGKASVRPLLILASLVAGYGSQRLLSALLRASVNRINKLGGGT